MRIDGSKGGPTICRPPILKFPCADPNHAQNKVVNYAYDNIGRVTSIGYSDSTPGVSYTYDENGYAGFLTRAMVTNVITTDYTYTTAGQLGSEKVTLNGVAGTFTTSYAYDQDGWITTIGYPSGRVVQRNYQTSGSTALDRLNTLADQTTSTTLAGSIQDNAYGQ